MSFLSSALIVREVSFLSRRGLMRVRGESSGGGNCEKLDEDEADVADDERRPGGDEMGEIGSGTSLGENIMALWS